MNNDPQAYANQLYADLREARKARDQVTVTTLQEVIAAIDNAGAVSAGVSSTGVGSTEAPRRELSTYDMQQIVQKEITELQDTINQLNNMQSPYAGELKHKVAILEKYI